MTPSVSLSDNNQISEVISALRACCQVDVLSQWHISADVDDISAVWEFEGWDVAELNSRGHVAWAGGRQVIWLVQRLVVPHNLNGYPLAGFKLRLALTWWGDAAQIFVNGKLVALGDLFDCSPRVLVSEGVSQGEEFVVAIRLVSPGHCDGALMRSLCVYEVHSLLIYEAKGLDPGFLADELGVVQRFLEVFAPERLSVLAGILEGMNHEGTKDAKEDDKEEGEFEKSLLLLRENLIQSKIQNPKSKIYLLGHAHLDLAWLWRVSETWEATQRTFESVLGLQEDFGELIFCHSSPVLYAWVEENRPDLFAAIREKVAAGVWEVLGGFWVEPDLNLISGESIVRQLLYGQRYVLEKFGQVSPVVWVPDSFGFCWSLPQFMRQGGVEFFVTQKLRWNDTTKFPYDVFWWKSPDGSEIFSLMSALIGETIDPVKMAAYACEWQSQTNIPDCLWLPGVGDHGGGPTRDMLEIARRWQDSPFFPQLEFTTSQKYLREIQGLGTRDKGLGSGEKDSPNPQSSFPTWNDELYLEFHRGCYTTHADQKRWNRRCENLLYEAELFASVASISAGVSYPQAELEAAWKQVLFHQFHDILPGSSITEVYRDALTVWLGVEKLGTEILQQSLEAIASQISLPTPPHPHALPIVVFNSLNWQRSEVVAVSLPDGETDWEISNLDGEVLPCQYNLTPSITPVSSETEGLGVRSLLFLAPDIPAVGYRLFWLSPQPSQNTIGTGKGNHTKIISESEQSFANKKSFAGNNFVLENQLLRVIVDDVTGNLASIFDKVNNREVLEEPGGNQLQAFHDSGQYWDAWNIDPNYQQHLLEAPQLKSITWVAQGCVESRVRVVRQIGESEFCCDYILQADSPLLKIATTVNWQESHVLVKAAFPLNLDADFATYEIPCAAIRRTTKPQTPAEQAKWEVPALRWADLTATELDNEENSSPSQIQNCYGVSLLNDCKYGYDSKPNQLRLTLLRSPHWPDPEADQGIHEFTYAIYPHAGSWEAAHTVRRGYELNHPLQVFLLKKNLPNSASQSLPPVASLLNLSADNLILMAFKQSEDNPQEWILRCYECHGEVAELSLISDLGLTLGEAVDLLEREVAVPEVLVSGESVRIQPWKIASFKVR
ncbi:MAG: alpha-mannosidase [Nostocaceae cyanobacterium]|nr:alpha-mannosidase [Nostocaceae cyanobacterium]